MKQLPGALHRYITRHPRQFALLSLFVAGALILTVVMSPPIVGVSATTRLLPVYSVQRDDKACSLTFDASWGNADTQTIIDILNRYEIKATFFVMGGWVEEYPESVQALHDAGMEVMNHSDTHPHCASLSAGELITELTACNEKIAAITGVTPTLFRCPFGEYDDNVIAGVTGLGMTAVQWDVDSLDWKDLSAADITQRVTSRVQPGSIVLFHNAGLHTPEALPEIIEYLIQEGYSMLPVSQLLLRGDYTIDTSGRQRPIS